MSLGNSCSSAGKERMEVFCRKCGAEIPEGSRFCGRCGTPVEEKPAVSEEWKNESSVVEGQSKSRKPLITGVCSGVLLLTVGTATLFATGVFGGKDETKEVVAETEESDKEQEVESEETKLDENAKLADTPDIEADKPADTSDVEANEPSDTKDSGESDASQDFLCSDSSSRMLTQEDIEELRSGTYKGLPEGKGIIQMVVNEMYARKGYQFGSQGIQDYFEARGWYRDIKQRNSDQESIYQNMSDIEKANVQFLSAFSEDGKVTDTYTTYCFYIAQFELSNGVLKVVADGAPGSGWIASDWEDREFSFRFPVAEDCQWKSGYYEGDNFVELGNGYEAVKEDIDVWRGLYDAVINGEIDGLESPVSLEIVVVDSVVTGVYTDHP